MNRSSSKIKVFLFVGILLAIFIFGTASAEAANWYVRKGSNGNGSSWTNAWDDINNINGLLAGDTVYIAAGNYTGAYTFIASGLSGMPITIKRAVISEHGSATGWSDSYDGTVNIASASSPTFTVSGRNNLVIDGVDKAKFILNGASARNYGIFGNGTSTHSIVIQNITGHHFTNSPIIFGKASGFGNNIEVAYSEFYKNGNSVAHDDDGSILLMYATAIGQGRNKIHDNYIHDGCITAALAACDLMTGNIHHTDIYNNHFDSGWTWENSSDMLHISGKYNNIYNNVFETDGWNQYIFIHTQNPAAVIPEYNYIYNNLFYKIPTQTGWAAIVFASYPGGTIRNTYIYNNTFYGQRWGINLGGDGQILNVSIKNNIFWPEAVEHRHINDNKNLVGSGQVTLDNNFYYTGDSTTVYYTGPGNKTVAQLQALGYELNGAGGGNPGFDSIANSSGFHLTASSPSPVLNGGADLSSIFTTDKDGTSRPQGAAWDIGAYEYLVSGPPPLDTTSPSIPTNLSATPISSSQINLSWIASTDNVGVLGYRIFRDSSQLSTVTGQLSYSDTNLSPSTSYTYTVSAYDAAGNNSNQSTSAKTTTLPTSSSSYEAESCILASPMQTISDPSASGGQYIQTSLSESGTATCSFSITTPGIYTLIAKVFTPNSGTDSFYFQMDNSPEDIWDLNPTASPSEYSVWREDSLAKRGTGTFDNPQYDPYTLSLSSGNHTFALRGREAGTRIDYFYLARVTDTTSPSAPIGLVVQ